MLETAVMTTALLVATTWSAGPAAAGMVEGLTGSLRATVDRTRLPIGDGNVSTSPTVGAVWACQTTFSGPGALVKGPWMRGDGTYDSTTKAVVDGEVAWPSQFSAELTGTTRTLMGNGLPAHTTGVYPVAQSDDAYRYDRNPNSIKEQAVRLTLPAMPALASQPSCLGGGPVGVLLTGSVLHVALDAAGRDAVAHETQDHCQGHPEPSGRYHYHNLTTCLEDGGGDHSPLMGYALDGFGMYGHHGEGGAALSNADLDACHGHAHTVAWDGETVDLYHYHATAEYPYTVGCMMGQSARPMLPGGGSGPGGPGNRGPGSGSPGCQTGQQQSPPPGSGAQGHGQGPAGGPGQRPGAGQLPPPGMGPRGGPNGGIFGPPPPR